MASGGEDVRMSVSSSIRMQRAGDAKIDTMSVVADIVAMGTRFEPQLVVVILFRCLAPYNPSSLCSQGDRASRHSCARIYGAFHMPRICLDACDDCLKKMT